MLNIEKDFLDPFRQKNRNPPAYVGLGKLIDAASRFAAYIGDAKVRAMKDHLVAETFKTQSPDGYIGVLLPSGRMWGLYEVGEMSYLVFGLSNDYAYFHNKASLAAAQKLAGYFITRWSAEPDRMPCSDGKREHLYENNVSGGHLLTLYQHTKDPKYLDFVFNFRHCQLQKWNSPVKMDEPNKPLPMDDERHCYIHMGQCVAQLQLYNLCADPRLLIQAQKTVEFLTRQDGLLVIGSCSKGECWHNNQAGDGNVCESCATAYLVRMLDRLLQITGNAHMGDMIERAVYNALFAAQSPDGRNIRYFTSLEGALAYYGDTYCCPNNFRRIISELPGMVCYRSGDGVAVDLYTQSTAKVELAGGRAVTVRQETDYPDSGLVKIVVTPSEAMEFPLRLRIPGWCPKAKLAINGETPTEVSPGERFYEIRRRWKAGDSVTLEMPMPWRLVRGRKLQEGRAALMRGPVVYCIGAGQNAELLKKYKEPRDLMIDVASLGRPVADKSIRPGGLKVLAKAWPPGDRAELAPPLGVVLTEFADPSGIATYFRTPDLNKAVDDELSIKR